MAQYTVAGALLLASCTRGANGGGPAVSAMGEGEIRITGTVHRAAVGANCWRFETPDGTGYELRPGQAPADLLTDGRQATLVVKPRIDLMSACQVGQIVDVVRVE